MNETTNHITYEVLRHYHDVSSLENVRILSCVHTSHTSHQRQTEWQLPFAYCHQHNMRYEEWNISAFFRFVVVVDTVASNWRGKRYKICGDVKLRWKFNLFNFSTSIYSFTELTWDMRLQINFYHAAQSFTLGLWINSSIKPLYDWFRCHVKFDRTTRTSRNRSAVIKLYELGRVRINRSRVMWMR